MADDDKTVQTPIPPVVVTMVGTGTGDGGGSPIPSGTTLKTPDHQPNVIIRVVAPIWAILVRAGYTFSTALVSALTVGGLTGEKILPHADFVELLHSAIFLASVTTGLGALKDVATVFSGLEKKFPLASGSV